MEALRIQNLRGLADTGTVALKPLTLLVGRNSSGKSTFLRSFPLLRQSSEARTKGPLLWYGPYVDFGSFGDALRIGATPPEIVFTFTLKLEPVPHYQRWWRDPAGLAHETRAEVAIHLAQAIESPRGDQIEHTYTRILRLSLDCEDHLIARLSPGGDVESLKVNGQEFLDKHKEVRARQGHILPHFFEPASSRGRVPSSEIYPDEQPLFHNQLVQALRPLFHGRTQEKTIDWIARRLRLGSAEKMLTEFSKLPASVTGRYFQRHITDLYPESPRFKQIRALLLASNLPILLRDCDNRLHNFARGISYVAPVRASAERYYRAQDLAVDELDFQGKNLAMFLHSLGPSRLREFANWTKKELGFAVTTEATGGHISLRMQELGAKRSYNLADMGFGFSQVLPIAAQLWILASRARLPRPRTRFFGIEQPELHLHPTYQAQLADFIMNTVETGKKFGHDLRLLVETHSPLIVNRIGQRIAEGDFNRSDVHIVLFERSPEEEETSVEIVDFDARGFLQNWPYGFFEGKLD